MENKYYIPSIEEFHPRFKFEMNDNNEFNITQRYIDDQNEKYWNEVNFGSNTTTDILHLSKLLYGGHIRVKYLDQQDIESCGIKKSIKNQWVGWYDYHGKINTGYPYYNRVTIHKPRMDDLYKIILHRWYDDEAPNIDKNIEDGEAEVVYKGRIKNISELKQVLTMIGVEYGN